MYGRHAPPRSCIGQRFAIVDNGAETRTEIAALGLVPNDLWLVSTLTIRGLIVLRSRLPLCCVHRPMAAATGSPSKSASSSSSTMGFAFAYNNPKFSDYTIKILTPEEDANDKSQASLEPSSKRQKSTLTSHIQTAIAAAADTTAETSDATSVTAPTATILAITETPSRAPSIQGDLRNSCSGQVAVNSAIVESDSAPAPASTSTTPSASSSSASSLSLTAAATAPTTPSGTTFGTTVGIAATLDNDSKLRRHSDATTLKPSYASSSRKRPIDSANESIILVSRAVIAHESEVFRKMIESG
jgi:hypothetical protein